jgi:N-acetyl-anhydromuramyl-L-alanine amidase AmpD
MGEKDKKGTKVATGKKTKVVVPTRYFSFFEHTDVKDLEKEALVIRQEVPFIPKDKKGKDLDEGDVTLEVYEVRDAQRERKPFLMFRVKGKVKKSEDYNFVVDSVEQDPKVLPQAHRPKNGRKQDMFLAAKLKIQGTDGKERGTTPLEIVLPPLEYDDTLELKLGSTIPNSAAGEAKVTWGVIPTTFPAGVRDMTAGMPHGGQQSELTGNLDLIVIHCTNAIKELVLDANGKTIKEPGEKWAKAKMRDKPSDAFDMQKNWAILAKQGLSAHYLVGRDGSIDQLVDVRRVAQHAGNDNDGSIGIEILCFDDNTRKETEAYAAKERASFEKARTKLEKRAEELRSSIASWTEQKEKGRTQVKVGKKNVPVDDAISGAETELEKNQGELAALAPSDWLTDFDAFTASKDAAGVPLIYKYTDAQYRALGTLFEALGKRYGYTRVAAHRRISKAGKTDPGKFFDWTQILDYLLPGGPLDDGETGANPKGGLYKVDLSKSSP